MTTSSLPRRSHARNCYTRATLQPLCKPPAPALPALGMPLSCATPPVRLCDNHPHPECASVPASCCCAPPWRLKPCKASATRLAVAGPSPAPCFACAGCRALLLAAGAVASVTAFSSCFFCLRFSFLAADLLLGLGGPGSSDQSQFTKRVVCDVVV